MSLWSLVSSWVCCGLWLAPALNAEPFFITFPSDIDWVTRSSPHFQVLYRRDHDALAERSLQAAERAYQLLTPIFPEAPPLTWIVLADFSDELNGYALDILLPHMVIYVSPPEPSGELAQLDDWLSSVILHEYTHNLHLYPASGLWAPLRSIFGSLMAPNGLMPRHFHEGLAVFTETHFTRGGRGRGTHFSMLRRMSVDTKAWGDDSFFSIDQMDGASRIWPFGTTAYFMGFQLYEALWKRKQGAGIREFVDSTSRLVPYFLNHPFESVFGENYASIWDKIFNETRLSTEMEIAQIRSQPLSTTERVTDTGFSKSDLHLSTSGKSAAFRSFHPVHGSRIEFWDLDKNELTRSEDEKVLGSEGMCWNSSDTELLVVVKTSIRGYSTNTLKLYRWASREFVGLTVKGVDGAKGVDGLKGVDGKALAHIHAIACESGLDSLITFEAVGGQGELVRYGLDGTHVLATRKDNWKVPVGSWVSGISSHLGITTFAVRRGVQTDFYRWSANSPVSPVLVQTASGHFHSLRPLDGEAVLAIGVTDGRDEIYIVDPGRNTLQKHAAFLGGVSSFDWRNKRLYALNYRHGGYDLEKISPISLPSRKLASTRLADTPDTPVMGTTVISSAEEYRPLSTLSPKTWSPLILFVPQGVQVAFWAPGADVSQRHYYEITGGYDSRGSLLGSLGYGYRSSHRRLGLGLYNSPNYLNTSDGLKLLARTGGYVGLDTTLGDFGVGMNFLASRLSVPHNNITLDSIGIGATASYSVGMKSRPQDVTPTRGTHVAATLSYYPRLLGSTDEFSVTTFRIDQYAPSILSGQGFYLSLRGGWTHGTVLANSFFEVGGEILFAPVRPSFFNRGFAPARFAAREVLNANVEYRFPIIQVDRGWGLFPLKLRRIHAALVSDFSTVDVSAGGGSRDRLFQDYYSSSGVELKSDWIGSYYFPTQIRLGLYHGYGPEGEPLFVSMAIEASI